MNHSKSASEATHGSVGYQIISPLFRKLSLSDNSPLTFYLTTSLSPPTFSLTFLPYTLDYSNSSYYIYSVTTLILHITFWRGCLRMEWHWRISPS